MSKMSWSYFFSFRRPVCEILTPPSVLYYLYAAQAEDPNKLNAYRYRVAKSAQPARRAAYGCTWGVGESVKTAEVIRDKVVEQNIMCLLHRELNPLHVLMGFKKNKKSHVDEVETAAEKWLIFSDLRSQLMSAVWFVLIRCDESFLCYRSVSGFLWAFPAVLFQPHNLHTHTHKHTPHHPVWLIIMQRPS